MVWVVVEVLHGYECFLEPYIICAAAISEKEI